LNFRSIVKLLSQGGLGFSQIAFDFLGRGDVLFHAVTLMHGPPQVSLKPVAGAVVVHIDDTFADGLTLTVEGLDRHEEIIPLGIGGCLSCHSIDLLVHGSHLNES